MKVVQSLSFQHEVDGRMYSLVFPVPAPVGECYDVALAVCNEFLKKLKEQQEEITKEAPEAAPEE